MTCAIIIPTLGYHDYFDQCIESIKKNTEYPYKLVIVADETDIKVDGATVITNTKRVGWTKAVNQGIKSVDAEYYCLLADDTIVTPKWLSKLVAGFASPIVGIISPITNTGGHGIQEMMNVPKDAHYDDILSVHERVERDHKPLLIEHAPLFFFCIAIPKTTIEKVGLMDERFYIAHPDLDYCVRLRQKSLRSFVRLDTYVHHYGSETVDKIEGHNKKWNEDTIKFNAKWKANLRLREEGV